MFDSASVLFLSANHVSFTEPVPKSGCARTFEASVASIIQAILNPASKSESIFFFFLYIVLTKISNSCIFLSKKSRLKKVTKNKRTHRVCVLIHLFLKFNFYQ